MGEIETDYAQEFQKIMSSASAEFTKAVQANMADFQHGNSTLMGSSSDHYTSGNGMFHDFMTASQNALDTANLSA